MPVCITGMHRSGTSMVARLLNLCGLSLGPPDRMMPPGADNPRGFWENVDIAVLNESILADLGGSWHALPLMKAGWESAPALDPLKGRAITVIRDLAGQEPWGWKDPRTSLTLAFWKRLIGDLKVVICLRNPLAVARSLKRRNNFAEADGLNLWLEYNSRLLAHTSPYERIVTHYDAYFDDPKKELHRLLAWLDIPASDEVVAKASGTISSSLRHSRFSPKDILNAGCSHEVLKLYAEMCKEAGCEYPQEWEKCKMTEQENEDNRDARAQHAYETIQGIINAGRYEEAVRELEKMLAEHPSHAMAHNDLGVLCFQGGQKEKAVKHFEESANFAPGNIRIMKNLALSYLDAGRIADGIHRYRDILASHPNDVETLLISGDLCRRLGQKEDAAIFFRRVMDIEPGNAVAIKSLQML